jgi:sirohydrochlorin ferrochelatase
MTSTPFRSAALALGVAAALHSSPLRAQGNASSVGTLIVAHGGGPSWDARVDSLAAAVRTGGPVAVSLLMGPGAATHRFQDAAARLATQGAREIVVVPLFVSSHSDHIEQVRYLAGATDSLSETMHHHLAMAGITRPVHPVPMRVTAALDDSPQLARVLTDHARSLAPAPGGRALFLIGHGPNGAEDHAAWMRKLRPVADSVARWAGFRDVKVGLVRDDAPAAVRAEAVQQIRETIRLQHALTGQPVVVVPILVSAGSVNREKIPVDLSGLPVLYDATPLLPHPAIAEWVAARVVGTMIPD